MSEVDPKDLQQCVACTCFNLRRASRAVTHVFERIMRPSGLRATQFPILSVLAMAGPSTITELSEILAMDRTTLARNLKPLEKQGLISVAPGKDRRTRTVALERRGSEALARALPLWEEAQSLVIERIGDKRWQELFEALSAIPSVLLREPAAVPAAEGAERVRV